MYIYILWRNLLLMDSTTLHNTGRRSLDPKANLAPAQLCELTYRPMFF